MKQSTYFHFIGFNTLISECVKNDELAKHENTV